jgi:hypothetical protein
VSDDAPKDTTNPNAFAHALRYVRRFVEQDTNPASIIYVRDDLPSGVSYRVHRHDELRDHLTVMLDALECMRELCQSAEKYQEQLEEHNVELILDRDAAVQRLATFRHIISTPCAN